MTEQFLTQVLDLIKPMLHDEEWMSHNFEFINYLTTQMTNIDWTSDNYIIQQTGSSYSDRYLLFKEAHNNDLILKISIRNFFDHQKNVDTTIEILPFKGIKEYWYGSDEALARLIVHERSERDTVKKFYLNDALNHLKIHEKSGFSENFIIKLKNKINLSCYINEFFNHPSEPHSFVRELKTYALPDNFWELLLIQSLSVRNQKREETTVIQKLLPNLIQNEEIKIYEPSHYYQLLKNFAFDTLQILKKNRDTWEYTSIEENIINHKDELIDFFEKCNLYQRLSEKNNEKHIFDKQNKPTKI